MYQTSGLLAEEVAVAWLIDRGYKLVTQNWRTRTAEIDIVATISKRLVFIEVKYRKNSTQGGGLDYITTTKLQQMKRAANEYLRDNNLADDYVIGAISLTGESPEVDEFIESINYDC